MRFILFTLFVVISSLPNTAKAQTEMDTVRHDSVCFFVSPTTANCDTIPNGPKHSVNYTIFNCSNDSFSIERTYTSCGCFVSYHPSYSIAPGESINISGVFYSKNRPGYFNKYMNVKLSTGDEFVLFIKGVVEPKRDMDSAE